MRHQDKTGKKLFHRLSFRKWEEKAEHATGLPVTVSALNLANQLFPGKGQCLPVYGANHLTNVPLTFYFLGMSVSHIKMRTTVLRKDHKSSLITTHFKIMWLYCYFALEHRLKEVSHPLGHWICSAGLKFWL